MENISIRSRKAGEPNKIYLNDFLYVLEEGTMISVLVGSSDPEFDGEREEAIEEYQHENYIVENVWYSSLYSRLILECDVNRSDRK